MGDRCNIVVTTKSLTATSTLADVIATGAVCFYGHWSGESMPSDVQRALAKRWRWDDASYLARIVFDEFADRGKETGYGISTELSDNEHPVLVIDTASQKVRFYGTGYVGPDEALESAQSAEWTFAEYITLDEAEISKAYGGEEVEEDE